MNLTFTPQSETLPPWWVFVLLAVLLLVQGTWMFIDARKRGRNAWLWGLWGVINFPSPLLVYLLVVVWVDYRKANKGTEE